MRFNAACDIDLVYLKERASKEAKLIFSKESTRQGRSFIDILATTMYGHAAEVYLIQHQKFKDDPRPFKDVIDLNGKNVEVKVTECKEYVPYVLARCEKYASEKWRNYPAIVYIFINNKRDMMYNLEGVYHWNGINFIRKPND
jgi:hypothetical protein